MEMEKEIFNPRREVKKIDFMLLNNKYTWIEHIGFTNKYFGFLNDAIGRDNNDGEDSNHSDAFEENSTESEEEEDEEEEQEDEESKKTKRSKNDDDDKEVEAAQFEGTRGGKYIRKIAEKSNANKPQHAKLINSLKKPAVNAPIRSMSASVSSTSMSGNKRR